MAISVRDLVERIDHIERTPLVHRSARIRAVDTHTAGEPTRIVVSGYPAPQGATMLERKRDLAFHHDELRRALMLEPRGHRDMFGAVLTPPVHAAADVGVIYMDTGGYLNMCGHGSIGVSAMLVATGAVPVDASGSARVVLDTPAGMVHAHVHSTSGTPDSVSVENVPAFVWRRGAAIETPYGLVDATIAFGGSFFALVDPTPLGIPLDVAHLPRVVELGMSILRSLREADEQPIHPLLDIRGVDLVEFSATSPTPGVDMRNVVVFGDAQIDRSPCGTGSSARVADLVDAGKLEVGREIVLESITGSTFRVGAVRRCDVAGRAGVVPRITGCAWVTGVGDYLLGEDDPERFGFTLL